MDINQDFMLCISNKFNLNSNRDNIEGQLIYFSCINSNILFKNLQIHILKQNCSLVIFSLFIYVLNKT